MAQLLSEVKEAWLRASYADYGYETGKTSPEIMTVKNKLATRTRLFVSELKSLKTKLD